MLGQKDQNREDKILCEAYTKVSILICAFTQHTSERSNIMNKKNEKMGGKKEIKRSLEETKKMGERVKN